MYKIILPWAPSWETLTNKKVKFQIGLVPEAIFTLLVMP